MVDLPGNYLSKSVRQGLSFKKWYEYIKKIVAGTYIPNRTHIDKTQKSAFYRIFKYVRQKTMFCVTARARSKTCRPAELPGSVFF